MSETRWFPAELVRAQRQVWAYEAASRAFVLAGPDSPVGSWPLPRQTEYRRLRESLEQTRRLLQQHPLIAAAIADRRWSATARALSRAAEHQAAEEQAAGGRSTDDRPHHLAAVAAVAAVAAA